MSTSAALFLFAHQDDEFGTFAQLAREIDAGSEVFCLFATDGAATADSATRNAESLGVLHTLGVPAQRVLFAGGELGIGDGRLNRHVQQLARWLSRFIDSLPHVERIYVPAWEGGHPDHDLLHAIVMHVVATRPVGLAALNVRQYSLYNARGCIGPLFRVLTPIPENGAPERVRIPVAERLRYLGFCLHYRSQWRSWIGLLPMVALNYLLVGAQQLQPVDPARIGQRPHAGTLYYERRGFLSWTAMQSALAQLAEPEGGSHAA